MQRIELVRLFAKPEKYTQSPITVCGWIRTVRDSKALGFLAVNDGSCFQNVQVVFEADKIQNFHEIAKQNGGAAVRVRGSLVLTPQAKQPFEINADEIHVLGASSPDYPLQKKRHTLEYLRTQAHLRPRSNTYSAAFRIRSACSFAIHRYFTENGFLYAHTPLISCSDCEGAGEMFRVTTLNLEHPSRDEDGAVDYTQDFFGKQAFLTVSGQLQGEAMAMAFGKIYTFGPTFRAEKSYTQRHAAEFWMVEPEIAFADLQDDMMLAEEMLKYVIGYVLETCPADLEFLNRFYDKQLLERLRTLAGAAFAHITYTKAIELLEPHNEQFEYPVHWGVDLQTEHERFLTEQVFHTPVFVTDYPKEIKAFYMRLNNDEQTVAAMDLLVPGIGEIIGGSQREERLDVLERRMEECGMNKENYWWYLDLRRYGGTEHSGFGLGFERLVMYLTGIANIRDVLPFPRTTGSAEF